ncbi:unnamed protein product [Ceutorhynchus assimilis]|uniref:Uncharacterized protein n=1 Tax=Ceutorhynchus assimilis TaxID=467358 RepID=A0A9N9QHB0_9CUCU|nr:unnamed protein product [Ceutorhynchus assimilis]
MQAVIVKNQVSSIADEKTRAEQKLEVANPALEEAEAAWNIIKPAHNSYCLYAESLKMMASTFTVQLQNYPKDILNNETVELLTLYFEMEDYHMYTAKRVCGSLLSWTKAMAFFHSDFYPTAGLTIKNSAKAWQILGW